MRLIYKGGEKNMTEKDLLNEIKANDNINIGTILPIIIKNDYSKCMEYLIDTNKTHATETIYNMVSIASSFRCLQMLNERGCKYLNAAVQDGTDRWRYSYRRRKDLHHEG